jgi:hypothetical protein
MNLSTIIQPCNDTGFLDPETTKGWGIVDFDWSNSKGTGTADGWCKHKPMDDEEMLFAQVKMTAAATPGTTVWVYRNTVYGYPWYTDVRKTLEDPAYADWYIKFKPEGPWESKKCDSALPHLCSDFYHSQEQSPGYPHGDGDCAAPGCDCGKVPCGFYVWNHSSTTVVNNQTFQDWFVNSMMLNEVGRSPYTNLVSGFFWDDVWNPGCNIHDQVGNTCIDMGFKCTAPKLGSEAGAGRNAPAHCDDPKLVQMTADYQKNMKALRAATLKAGKFAWQMLWTGGAEDSIGGGSTRPLVTKLNCAPTLHSMCSMSSPAQTRAMAYGINGTSEAPSDLLQDLANFLLTRSPYSWLGWGWGQSPQARATGGPPGGCKRTYTFPPEFNEDYGAPAAGAAGLCKETAPGSEVFTRKYSKATVELDCKAWHGKITMADGRVLEDAV